MSMTDEQRATLTKVQRWVRPWYRDTSYYSEELDVMEASWYRELFVVSSRDTRTPIVGVVYLLRRGGFLCWGLNGEEVRPASAEEGMRLVDERLRAQGYTLFEKDTKS